MAEEQQEPGGEQAAAEEVMKAIREIEVGQLLLSTVSTLSSVAYGKLESKDLDEARAAIDAIHALLPVLEGRVEGELLRDFKQALANLQVAYADAAERASS